MIFSEKLVFPVINLDEDHSWDQLVDLCRGYLDLPGLKRLRVLLETHCQSIILEREYIDKDYRNTFANFHAKRFNTPPSRCLRLHFFTKHFTKDPTQSGLSLLENGNEYLGYSVIRATRPNSIGRTLISDAVRLDTESHLCLCSENVHILGEKLSVRGFPFISQDADATVCAESSLWMLLRYFSNRYPTYAETLPFQITQLAGNHAIGRRVFPSAGLTSWQLAEALRLNKFSPIIYSRPLKKGNEDVSAFAKRIKKFEHLLYTYIESGFPLLTTVNDHVFPAFGHSSDFSNPPTQIPGDPNGYIFTSEFNQSITICDDNFYPYQTLHRRIPGSDARSSYTLTDINEFIVPLPEKVFLTAEDAQAAIERILKDPKSGITNNSPSLSDKSLTLRLFLTSSRAFKAKLRERSMGHQLVNSYYRQLPLPHFIWICELALTNEYCSEHRIKGEVIWDATRNAHEPHGWLAVHYPEMLSLDIGSTLNHPREIKQFSLDNHESYRLFESNLKPCTK